LSVDYDLVPIPPHKIDNQIFMEGAKWASAKENHLKSRLSKFRKGPQKPNEWAQAAAPKLREQYSLKNIFSIYDNRLGKVIDRS